MGRNSCSLIIQYWNENKQIKYIQFFGRIESNHSHPICPMFHSIYCKKCLFAFAIRINDGILTEQWFRWASQITLETFDEQVAWSVNQFVTQYFVVLFLMSMWLRLFRIYLNSIPCYQNNTPRLIFIRNIVVAVCWVINKSRTYIEII